MPSRQKKHGGGKFKSESQRKFMWAVVPAAAKAWAHNKSTRKSQWTGAAHAVGRRKGRAR